MDTRICPLAVSTIDAEGYRQLIALFDGLWSSRPTPQTEQTMRTLLALIEQYETNFAVTIMKQQPPDFFDNDHQGEMT